MHSNLGYDPIKDFSSISQLSRSLNALIVHPDVPARTLAEFVAHLKANPTSCTTAPAAAAWAS